MRKEKAVSALSTRDLGVRYGQHHALKGLSIDIAPGELVGVIGPNGAGKTSFIKALCGRLNPTGDIHIQGKPLRRGHDRRRLIGLVPQDIGLYGHMSATENLSVIAKLLGVKRRGRKDMIADALNAVDMGAKADTRIDAMSGGMKRRINVAAAIMHDPALIIFDEPTAGVDIPARDTVHRLARKLAERGKAVILVTHELEQAEALCDKILILCEGELLAFDRAAALLGRSFGGQREVIVRYAQAPDEPTRAAMAAFNFQMAELPTVWTAMTEASEVSFVSAFVTALRGANQVVREITVRRPGLTSLMHRIERTGAL